MIDTGIHVGGKTQQIVVDMSVGLGLLLFFYVVSGHRVGISVFPSNGE